MSTEKPHGAVRNQSMELCKFLASFFVVFIHVRFPGSTGNLVDCLGRFAVPMFFAISGYFNYQSSADRILRRTRHILGLYLIAVAAHLLWSCIATELNGGSSVARLIQAIPDPDEFSRWIILQIDPFSGHLWYMNSAIVTYLVYWCYVKFFNGRTVNYLPLYFAGFVLFAIFFVMGVMAIVMDVEVNYYLCRTAWLTGLPMFIFGIFLRNYQEQIFDAFSLRAWKLMAAIVLGIVLTVQQFFAVDANMPFGTLISVAALMLLLISHPVIVHKDGFLKNLILKLGPWSTWIYLMHLIVDDVYERFVQPSVLSALGQTEDVLRPVIVLVLSVAVAVLCHQLDTLIRRIRSK